MKKFLKNQKGLTLVELLAVIVILGIIAAIAVPAIGNIIENSRKDAQVANAEALYDAARLAQIGENVSGDAVFVAEGNPSEDLATKDLIGLNYMDEMPDDPMGGGAYTEAYVVYSGDTFLITLGTSVGLYFDGDSIQAIRDKERDAIVLD